MQAHEQDARNFVGANFPALAQFVAAGEYAPGYPLVAGEKEWFAQALADSSIIDREYRRFVPVLPDLTFEDRLTLWVGGREIQLLHLGAGNTAGDVILWLPAERVAAVGDLLVLPVPYGHGGHAGAWARTLDAVAALAPRVLVPGHGPVQRDLAYLELVQTTLRAVDVEVRDLVGAGRSMEEVLATVDLAEVEPRFTHGDAFATARFREWFTRPIVEATVRLVTGQDPDILPPR